MNSVALVTEDDLSRERLAEALATGGVTIDAHETNVRSVIGAGGTTPHDVVAAGGSDGWFADVATLRDSMPGTRIVVVVPQDDKEGMRKALRAGVDGIVTDDRLDALVSTLAAARAGQLCVPSELRRQIDKPALSFREKQVLSMVVLGFSNAEIAAKLFLAESTVKSHLSSAFSKLGVRSRSEAAAVILDPSNSLGTGILSISDRANGASPRLLA